MKNLMTLCLLSLLPFTASAIQYVKGSGKISAGDFDSCAKKVYRKEAQDELSPENRRQAVKDALTGSTINDLAAVKKFLADHPEACSYGSDNEKF